MEYYERVIIDTLTDIVADGYETKEQVLQRWLDGDTQDDFGNLTGSRECSTYKAEQALKEAGFPFNQDLNDLLSEVGYDIKILDRGAEVVDVIFCELIAPRVASDLLYELHH